MSVLKILDSILLKPLQLIFEFIWSITDVSSISKSKAIIILSLSINILTLPFYMRAEVMQEEERRIEKQLQKGVSHIKKTFKGDEQLMILRTYYRQNNYKPSYVLRGAISLFLEIPFFIVAYRFLSGLQIPNNVSFGPISNLGLPDGTLQIAGFSINILPFIMTAVNLVNCLFFTKDSPRKTKLQLYGMAVFFLIFLYSSPAVLVIYWTLNNLFSLIKTILYKLNDHYPLNNTIFCKLKKYLKIIFTIVGALMLLYSSFIFMLAETKKLFVITGLLLQLPTIFNLLKKLGIFKVKKIKETPNRSVFLSGGIFLSILTGVLIPSAVIKSSPQEFVKIELFYHPIWYILSSFCIAIGLFVFWMGVFYWLASPSIKSKLDRAIWIFSGVTITNYMFFDKNFGNLSANLQYENRLTYTLTEQLLNIIIILTLSILLYAIYGIFKKRAHEILSIGAVALVIMSVINLSFINSSFKEINIDNNIDKEEVEVQEITLSRTGKNVIIIMLDRAMGEQVPYIFEEKPELKMQFDGFTYYSNTISFGGHTNFAIPALVGGYEYTPVEMNRRNDISLEEKHTEALRVMPVLFNENGYKVTVINPIYANYQWIPDTTIYDDYTDIQCYTGINTSLSMEDDINYFIEQNNRNFFCYSMLRTMPLCIRYYIYDTGFYNQPIKIFNYAQYVNSPVTAQGVSSQFLQLYTSLEQLPYIVNITTEDINTFFFMANEITHSPILLQEPDYILSDVVDNTEYEDIPLGRVLDGHILKLETTNQMTHYHTNMAAMIQLGKLFEYMREEGVFDNTRIILVSDHGYPLYSIDELIMDNDKCLSEFFPLLMVKDFGSSGFNTSDEFMTNADVPTIAVRDIISNPINPFTGNQINSDEKLAHDQYIIDSDMHNINNNNGNTFLPGDWYSIHDNIWDKYNWTFAAEDDVLNSYD